MGDVSHDHMNQRTLIFAIPLLLVLGGCDQITGPRDYDECILQSMKGVNSDMAARSIVRSCREKFPEQKLDDSPLPSNVLSQLTGHAGMGDFGYFSGSIYNGSRDWTVTQVTVSLIPQEKGKEAVDLFAAKEYNTSVAVAPLTSSSFSFAVDGPKQEYFWNIVGARGHK